MNEEIKKINEILSRSDKRIICRIFPSRQTFIYKDEIKAIGFKWDRYIKIWEKQARDELEFSKLRLWCYERRLKIKRYG